MNEEILLKNIQNIKDFVLSMDSDWVFANTGEEGSGKSMLSLYIAKKIEKKLNLRETVAFTMKEYLELVKKHRENPGKVLIFDEAVSSFFSRESMGKFNRVITKLFIINRSMNHIHILNIPNFYYLDVYLREHRIKTLLFSYYDLLNNKRLSSWYGKEQIADLNNPEKKKYYRILMVKGAKFVEKFRPIFHFSIDIEELSDIKEEYEKLKVDFQTDFLTEAEKEIMQEEIKDFEKNLVEILANNKEFLKKILILEKIRRFLKKEEVKITLGIDDIYKTIKNNRWGLSIKEILKIATEIKKLGLAEIKINENKVKFDIKSLNWFYFVDIAEQKIDLEDLEVPKKYVPDPAELLRENILDKVIRELEN
ncbi:MAG TPA: hypothetical protein EYH56_02135 [Nanoarchaeota archaeon]|nr:hypothetical protein [Nanoarchaeota archaeon]